MPVVELRDAVEGDLPAILDIYNDVILTSTAVYSEDPVDLADRTAWWQKRQIDGLPVLTAHIGDELIGFGSFGEFRSWPCYRYTVEHSVHVRADRRGKGVGTRLVLALAQRGGELGKHIMIAGIDAENIASRRLHEKLGFIEIGHFREVGWKFGRWLDLVFLQLSLSNEATAAGVFRVSSAQG